MTWFGWARLLMVGAIVGVSTLASAMTVQPILVEMEPTGSKARGTIEVTNTRTGPLPVEIRIQRIEINEDGAETLADATDAFAVFPPQAIIQPGRTQSFQVRWAGDPRLQRSESYGIVVAQLPVAVPQDTPDASGIQVLYNFRVLANVGPTGATAAPTIARTSVEPAKDNEPARVAVTVKNDGARHAMLSEMSLRVAQGNEVVTLSPSTLQQRIGLGVIQPGKQRRFVLPVEANGQPIVIDIVK